MKAGIYYVGDLCYVASREWREICDLTTSSREGVFALKDGRKFAMLNTMYGDGVYYDQNKKEYSVDSGTLGCMLLSECEPIPLDLGQEIHFKEDFEVTKRGGVINFGDVVVINTDYGWEHDE